MSRAIIRTGDKTAKTIILPSGKIMQTWRHNLEWGSELTFACYRSKVHFMMNEAHRHGVISRKAVTP